MLKQSYIYLILQLLNIGISLFVTIYIAKNVDMQTFAIFAIYTIIVTLFMTFSFLGYESILIRNVLHWKKIGKINKIKNYISYALISRAVVSVLLTIPILLYIYYISINKFNDEHLLLFSSFIIAGFFSSLSNANALILKAFNKYILSFTITTLSLIIGRLIAIYIFTIYGFYGFMLTLIIIPIFTFLLSFLFVKSYFSFSHIRYKYFFKFKRNKYFILSGYLNYFKVSIDQILVSIFLSVEILAVYNLAKKVEEIGRSIIEGFFDPIIQKLVSFKNDINNAVKYKKKIYLIKNIFLLITITFVIIFNLYINDVIVVTELEHYKNLSYYLIFASWVPVLYILFKVQSNIIYLFDHQKTLFKIDIFIGILTSLVMVLFFIIIMENIIYLNRVVINIIVGIFFIYFYKNHFYKKSIFFKEN